MTISLQTYRSQYAGNGTTVAFATGFMFLANTELSVTKQNTTTGVVTTLALGADYSVAGAGVSSGGTVTTVTAPTASERLTIERNMSLTQEADFTDLGPFPAEDTEKMGDKITMILQQFRGDLDRALKIAKGESTTISTDLGTFVERANKFLYFDSLGNPQYQALTAATSTLVTADGSTVARSLGERFAETINVKDHGAVGDGVTNDTAAIQAAAALAYGKNLYFPKGSGAYITSGKINLPKACFVRFDPGATMKLANGTIVNTDADLGHFTPFFRCEAPEYLEIAYGILDHNRDNQTYRATSGIVGRGNSAFRHNAMIEVSSDGVNRGRNIYIHDNELKNSYLSAFQVIQCDNISFFRNYTHDNTWNGCGGGNVNNVNCFGNVSYRDGSYDGTGHYDTAMNNGDRGGFQFRELPTEAITTASEGIPIISGTPRGINSNVHVFNNFVEESGVISVFIRSCINAKISGNIGKNAGYNRKNASSYLGGAYFPAFWWFEWGSCHIHGNMAWQTQVRSGDMQPENIVCVTMKNDGTASIPIDGDYYCVIENNVGICGVEYDGVDGNYQSDALKRTNFYRHVRVNGNAIIRNNLFEGVVADADVVGPSADPSFINMVNDASFVNPRYIENVEVYGNTMFNCEATKVFHIAQFSTGLAGNPNNIKISHNKIFDLRGVGVGLEDQIVIPIPTNWGTLKISDFEVSDNYVDCTNSADATKHYEFIRMRGDNTSDLAVLRNRVKNPKAFVRWGTFDMLHMHDNIVTGCPNPLIMDMNGLGNAGTLSMRNNRFSGVTSRVINFNHPGGEYLQTFIYQGNYADGTVGDLMANVRPGVNQREVLWSGNIDRTVQAFAPGTLADGVGLLSGFNKPMIDLGDILLPGFDQDLLGVWHCVYAKGPGSFGSRLENETGASQTITAGTLRVHKREKHDGDLEAYAAVAGFTIADGNTQAGTVTVTGAALGDYVLLSYAEDLTGVMLFGYVSAADTVAYRFENRKGSSHTFTGAPLRVVVVPKHRAVQGLTYTAVYDPASLADGAGVETTIAAAQAVLGDFVHVSFSLDLAGVILTAWVSAAGTISCRFQNESGGVVDLGSGTISVAIERPKTYEA